MFSLTPFPPGSEIEVFKGHLSTRAFNLTPSGLHWDQHFVNIGYFPLFILSSLS